MLGEPSGISEWSVMASLAQMTGKARASSCAAARRKDQFSMIKPELGDSPGVSAWKTASWGPLQTIATAAPSLLPIDALSSS
jgi:hypothetical protein